MTEPLDPAQDPDRYAGEGRTLPEMLGEDGTHEGERNNLEWLYGLLGVLGFLLLFTLMVTYL